MVQNWCGTRHQRRAHCQVRPCSMVRLAFAGPVPACENLLGAARMLLRAAWLVLLAGLMLALGGCAADAFRGPSPGALVAQYPPPGGQPGALGQYEGGDGAALAYVAYRNRGAKSALVYLHGIESHAGWFALAAEALVDEGFDVYCLDRRGSGLNRENRGFVSGHVDRYQTLLADLQAFIVPLRQRYDRVSLVGLSWGGKLALSYGLSFPQDVDGLVLITPGLRAAVDVSPWNKMKIALLSVLDPTARVSVPIQPEMFTTTPLYLEYIRRDPLRLKSATVRFFWQSRALDRYVERNIVGNRLPVPLFLAGEDRIIDNQGVLDVLRRGAAPELALVTYPEQTHSVQLDAPRRLAQDVATWVRQRAQ
jgi:acylglycerol lipase